ncbi:MAG: methylmalonyl-CoA carboxyltransferase, partial [Actinomycetia bacterium]|nr:methylmalonyl-CoA carboxyltransferase [Actinomycetes bacterium]
MNTAETDPDELDPVADLHERADQVRNDMGGADRVTAMRNAGVPTIRDHIDAVLDDGSFRELGTFSRSMKLDDRHNTPGDGKVGGEG